MGVWNHLKQNHSDATGNSIVPVGLDEIEAATLRAISEYGGSASSFQLLGKVSHITNNKNVKIDVIQKAVSSLEGKNVVVVVERFANGSAKKINRK